MSKKNLIIVESPSKIKTLKKFLGDEYEIETSIRMGCWNGEKYEYFSVPSNEANRHYQEYLAWVAKGNTAEVIEKWPDPPEE